MYRILLAALLLGSSSLALADDIDNLDALAQNQFHGLSADLGAVLQFKQLAPAEPEGLTGFDFGFDVSATQIEHDDAWQIATSGDDVSTVPMARVRLTKGLPGGIDIGGFYSIAPGTNIKAYGAELRYAILEGGVTTPAIGLRGTYNKITGVDHLGFHTGSLELSISKGFGPVTPYAGAGRIWVSSNPGASTGLQNESFGENEVFVGLDVGMPFMDLVFEANRIGDNLTYSVKLSFGL
ncbi:MAG TPA: hypothetical protein VFH57_03835 [Gammaproteobacteria bacterium]|nr:hypothetical protein [Gammaproteobacteria bacterium]